MTIEDITCKCAEEIKAAASLLATQGEPQPMVNLINQIQRESFMEGFRSAIEVLQDTLDTPIQKGGKNL